MLDAWVYRDRGEGRGGKGRGGEGLGGMLYRRVGADSMSRMASFCIVGILWILCFLGECQCWYSWGISFRMKQLKPSTRGVGNCKFQRGSRWRGQGTYGSKTLYVFKKQLDLAAGAQGIQGCEGVGGKAGSGYWVGWSVMIIMNGVVGLVGRMASSRSYIFMFLALVHVEVQRVFYNCWQ